MIITKLLLTLTLILIPFTICYAEDVRHDPINIGVLLALTGPYPMQGNAFMEGLLLAEDEINNNGGINGRKIKLVIEDTVNEAKNALTAAKKLVSQDKVVAALMSSYPEYRTGGMELQKNNIPVIALWDSSPELDEMGEYIFGMGPWTPSSGEVSAKFAVNELKAKTATIITSVDPWAELVSSYFEEEFKRLGGKIIEKHSLIPDTSDFKTILARSKVSNPDVIFSPIINNIPTFYRQRYELKYKAKFISADIISDEHIAKVPQALEGVFMSRNKDPNNELSKQLFEKYSKKYGRPVTMPWFISTAYDGVMILAHALRNGADSGSKIKDYLYTIKDFPGTTQSFTFNKQGSAAQLAVIYKITNGRFEYFWETK